MKIVYWVKGARGVACLRRAVESGRDVAMLVMQPQPGKDWYGDAAAIADKAGILVMDLDDPGDAAALTRLGGIGADVFVLAGYGKILPPETIALPGLMCINLHGGDLPHMRGSSPMNWALMGGLEEHGICVIRVAPGVDTGDVLARRVFPIGPDETIRDLHARADAEFPDMLEEVLDGLERGDLVPEPQDEAGAGYYPLRFPEDGLVLFDQLTAREIHNRIRALTRPYPCAYTYYRGRKVLLVSSRLRQSPFYGQPGRIYLVRGGEFLVCARDECLWLTGAEFEDDGASLASVVARYDRLATVAQAAEKILSKQ